MSSRVAFVTGGAQGIGEAIALGLAVDGFDVAILDIKGKEELLQSVAKKITKSGRRALWLTGDVTDEDAVKNAIAETVEKLGSLDVVRRTFTGAKHANFDMPLADGSQRRDHAGRSGCRP